MYNIKKNKKRSTLQIIGLHNRSTHVGKLIFHLGKTLFIGKFLQFALLMRSSLTINLSRDFEVVVEINVIKMIYILCIWYIYSQPYIHVRYNSIELWSIRIPTFSELFLPNNSRYDNFVIDSIFWKPNVISSCKMRKKKNNNNNFIKVLFLVSINLLRNVKNITCFFHSLIQKYWQLNFSIIRVLF